MEAISILTPGDVEAVHERAMTILEEIGTDVRHAGALELLRSHGQAVDGERVRWDREFVMEMVATAPASFVLEPRNPDRAVTIGGGKPVLAPSAARRSAPTWSAAAARAGSPTTSSWSRSPTRPT